MTQPLKDLCHYIRRMLIFLSIDLIALNNNKFCFNSCFYARERVMMFILLFYECKVHSFLGILSKYDKL